METTNFELKIKEGYGELKFGMLVEECVRMLGDPDEVETIENTDDGDTLVLYYDSFTLFFEGEGDRLSCIDLGDVEATLFGKKVFDIDDTELVELMDANGYSKQNADREEPGCISYNDGNIDFYFENDNLVSIIFGK